MQKTINQNQKFNSIELRYTSKPSPEILDLLHLSAFKWAPTKKHWFAPRNPENESFARSLGKTIQTKLVFDESQATGTGEYNFKFKPGQKVIDNFQNKEWIVKLSYIANGKNRYTIYPPGKKDIVGLHTWVQESDLKAAKTGTKTTGTKTTGTAAKSKKKPKPTQINIQPFIKSLPGVFSFTHNQQKLLSGLREGVLIYNGLISKRNYDKDKAQVILKSIESTKAKLSKEFA